jgi:molybdenum cofactor cytidylyltransferase
VGRAGELSPNGRMATAALILSGGESSRFGGSPKALLRIGEESAIRRIAEICVTDGFEPVAVVVGPHKGPIARELQGLAVTIVEADRWYEGRTASMQAGVAAIPDGRDILFWPVDHPFVAGRTVDSLLATRDTDLLAVWMIPTYEGRGGHPVLWRTTMRRELLALRPDAPIRSLIPEFGPQVRRLPVDDPGVIAHVDTPEEYRAALDLWGRREDLR